MDRSMPSNLTSMTRSGCRHCRSTTNIRIPRCPFFTIHMVEEKEPPPPQRRSPESHTCSPPPRAAAPASPISHPSGSRHHCDNPTAQTGMPAPGPDPPGLKPTEAQDAGTMAGDAGGHRSRHRLARIWCPSRSQEVGQGHTTANSRTLEAQIEPGWAQIWAAPPWPSTQPAGCCFPCSGRTCTSVATGRLAAAPPHRKPGLDRIPAHRRRQHCPAQPAPRAGRRWPPPPAPPGLCPAARADGGGGGTEGEGRRLGDDGVAPASPAGSDQGRSVFFTLAILWIV
jgi:hypothetical protein